MSFHSRWINFLNCLTLFCLFLFSPHIALAENMPTSYVVAEAGIIDATIEHRLAGHLQELEQKTGSQMIVLTVATTDGVPIDMFALEKAENWKLGQKGKDNGLLMVIAVNDRKYRIEVGYGLESIIPDSLAGTIARKYLVPRFQAGDYTTGIYETAVIIMSTIAKAQGVGGRRRPEESFPAGFAVGNEEEKDEGDPEGVEGVEFCDAGLIPEADAESKHQGGETAEQGVFCQPECRQADQAEDCCHCSTN